MTTAGPVRCPLLIGRDGLLDVAERRLGDVEAGRGQFLLVAGTAGIGKTRFLDAVTQRAEARGFGSVWSAVTPMDRDLPAASIVDTRRGPWAESPRMPTSGATCGRCAHRPWNRTTPSAATS